MSDAICSIPDCGKRVHSRDMCPMHYQRWRNHGDPLISRRQEWLTCTDCGQEFERPSQRGHGPVRCLPCRKQRRRDRVNAWHRDDRNRERVLASKRRKPPVTDPLCTVCGAQFARNSMKGNIPRRCPDCAEVHRREVARIGMRQRTLAKYGLTPEQFDALLDAQGRACAICKTDQWGHQGPQIDHCHVVGEVRGLLCQLCNVGLGHFRDDPVVIATALDYVRRGRADGYPAADRHDEVVMSQL